MSKDFFRHEALEANKTGYLGDVILIRPLSFSVLTAIAVIISIAILSFLKFGSYTRHNTVYGQIVNASGLVKVYSPQTGIILERRINDGHQIHQGDVLYVLSSDRQSSSLGKTQEFISTETQARISSLISQKKRTQLLHKEESDAISKMIESYSLELKSLDRQEQGQNYRVKLAKNTVERYQRLSNENFVTEEHLQQKQEDLIDQQSRLQDIQRESGVISRELKSKQNEMNSLPIRHRNELEQLDRNLSIARQELVESESKRKIVIVAPESGYVTAVVAEPGQTVDINKPLVSIVPNNTKVQAFLYAPTRSVGFVKLGDMVTLRFQAYPYQKFGQYAGKVISIAKTALPRAELIGIGNNVMQDNGISNGEPLYRITVSLQDANITAYGKKQPLRDGMLLEADILQDTRCLYEWVFEPLYGMKGNLKLF